jgi:putative membrane protein
MISRQQDWLDILLNRINLTFEQNNVIGQGMQPGSLHNKIMVPSITANECQTLINDVFPDNTMEELTYTRISKRFLLRNIGYILTPLLIALSVLAVITNKLSLLNYIVPVYVLLSGLIFCRWYRWGYARDKQFIYVRKGVLGVDYYCFPIYKVQQTKFKQSIFLKRHQLCSLSIVLASGAVHVPYMSEKQGYDITNDILYQVEESRRSWM